jgi:hypothetical protein
MRVIGLVIIVSIYAILGSYIEGKEFIVSPAAWSFYGYVWGTLALAIYTWPKR